MVIKPNQVFIGSIRRCTKYEPFYILSCSTNTEKIERWQDAYSCHYDTRSVPYKERAILIQVEGGFVDVDRLKTIFDELKLKKAMQRKPDQKQSLGRLVIPTKAHGVKSLFVDVDSLEPYHYEDPQKEVPVVYLKKARKNSQRNDQK